MNNIEFNLNSKTSLHQLELNRKVYKNIKWLSSHNRSTRIWEMEDSYLINVMKNIASSLVASKTFPLVEEFKSYNGTSYHNFAQFCYNEYLYRNSVLEAQYNDYLEMQIQEDLAKERQHNIDPDYYEDRYGLMAWY